MKRKTKYLIIISFDGLSTLDFEYINTLPNFKRFIQNSSYCRNVYSIYPSLTYPAHASIVTGKHPKNHKIINNTLIQPNRISPDWYWQRSYIKSQTFYDIAINNGMKVAALLWPVTGKSKIQYNMPEIFSNRPWQNQIIVSLLNGSPMYQIGMNHKYGNIRKGKSQPELDNFIQKCLINTLTNKKPDITMAHFTDLDTKRHYHGFDSKEAKDSLLRHDKRLGEILDCLKETDMDEDSTLVILGDHSSLNEDKIINFNVVLKEEGFIKVNSKNEIKEWKAILKNCGGSAYIYTKNNDSEMKNKIKKILEKFNSKYNCIEQILTSEEASYLGADSECDFMLEAKKGYYFLDSHRGEPIKNVKIEDVGNVPHITLSTHGYSPYKKDYTTVFIAKGKGIKPGVKIDNMSLVDQGGTFSRLLGFELENIDGRVLEEILD
ncbi:alkaline phosphatase family protein [Clostridium sp. D2Q-11]|uniref:Alkaline phosphatase family protein n=1 Tax=Anaeromonas frigoriresistens TaxID=2683708 RepID=A0A942Z7N0_9FIRM|nr:ectonucleotide pyrophosphatase/phosphodiesterase [Anaeromonas frigoriresistens]MBS4537125.1 alkaline phosphatase family protein [Anaeromonas frigoriresistens]